MTVKERRVYVYQKFNGHCAYCGCELEYKDMTVDHVKPVIRDLIYDRKKHRLMTTNKMLRPENNCVENEFPACRPCNNFKHSMSIEEFRKCVAHQGRVMRNLKAGFRIAERFGLIAVVEKPVVFYFETFKKEEV